MTADDAREPMRDTRLEQLAGLAELPCSCGVADCENFMSALTREQAQELVAEAKRVRAEVEQLRAQLVQAREEGAARAALGTSPAVWCWSRHPDHPLSCGRFAGHEGQHVRGEHRWDDEQQTEDGDRG